MNQVNNQKGATLVVSLVLLLILTLMGISASENVNLQAHMARTSQFQIHAYQIALSEIKAQLLVLDTDIASLNSAAVNGTDAQTGDEIAMQPQHFNQTVGYAYMGEGLPQTGYSVDTYIGRLFELNSRAQVNNTGVFSDQTQGLNYAGPK